MPVPKKRTSRSRTHTRRAHDSLSKTFAVVCPNCGAHVLRHRVCMSCGSYRGKQLVQTAAATES